MKRYLFLVIVLFISSATFSQEDRKNDDEIITLAKNSSSIGGYGGISLLYSQIDNRDALVFGARGGVVFNHSLTVGLGGAGFINESKEGINTDEHYSLAGGYGGVLIEPIIFPKTPVHLSIPILFGVGGVANTVRYDYDDDPWGYDETDVLDGDAFIFIEPGIELELNVVKFFRFSLGAYYRKTSDIKLDGIPKDALDGFSYGVSFKFGRF